MNRGIILKISTLLVSILLASLAPITVCGQQPMYGGTLVMVHMDAPVVNPVFETSNIWYPPLIFDGLVTINAEGEIEASLATDWEISNDGLNFTFYLREGVEFHDGHSFTSADVKFTFETILDPEVASPMASLYEAIDTVEAPDDYTVTFLLKNPDAPFFGRLWIGIIPKHLFEDLDPSEMPQGPLIGTGPWVLEEHIVGDHFTYEAFENYWGGRPYIDEIIQQIVPETSTAVAALEAGDVHFIPGCGITGGIAYELVDTAQQNPDVEVSLYTEARPYTLFYRHDIPPWNNITVRQAIAYAIDKEYMVSAALSGYGEPAYSMISPALSVYHTTDLEKYPYNPELAEELLDQAGYPRSDGGVRFETTIYGNPGLRSLVSEILEAFLDDVGIECNIDITEYTTYWDKIGVRKDYDGMFTLYLTHADPDDRLSNYHSRYYDVAGLNYIYYNNSEYDELIDAGRIETDIEERAEIYHELQQLIAEDLMAIPLFHFQGVDLYREEVHGLESKIFAGRTLDSLKDAWLETEEAPPSWFDQYGLWIAVVVIVVVIAVVAIYMFMKKGPEPRS